MLKLRINLRNKFPYLNILITYRGLPPRQNLDLYTKAWILSQFSQRPLNKIVEITKNILA